MITVPNKNMENHHLSICNKYRYIDLVEFDYEVIYEMILLFDKL